MKTIYRWINHEQVPCEVVPYKMAIIYDPVAQTARVVDGEPDGAVYGSDYRPDAERYAAAIEAAARHVKPGTPLATECGDTRCALRYDPPEVAARVAFEPADAS